MRKRFDPQLTLGTVLISDVELPLRSRDELPPILGTLQYIFGNADLNESIFKILEKKICDGKKKTGRTGMDLWHVLVLAVIRHGMGINWDTLELMANDFALVRGILGVHNPVSDMNKSLKITFNRQSVIDNVSLLDDALIHDINMLIVDAGHKIVNKKKAEEPLVLELKTDSYVLETNVHFPTDLNLLWDSMRKCLDMVGKLAKASGISYMPGWREIKSYRLKLKSLFRRTTVQVFNGRSEKMKIQLVNEYIEQSRKLVTDCNALMKSLETTTNKKIKAIVKQLNEYCTYASKFDNQIERRLINKEVIPAEEKVFSIFEPDTEWITKGKLNKQVELGHLLLVTTDQHQLIVDYKVMEDEKDPAQVPPLMERIKENFKGIKICSHSFDKGFYSKTNKEAVKDAKVENVIMPKKGKLNKMQKEEESQLLFKQLRNAHSAVESNIHSIKCHGLARCMDKGTKHYKRTVGLSVLAYNLHIIGNTILADERKKQDILEKQRERYQRKAA